MNFNTKIIEHFNRVLSWLMLFVLFIYLAVNCKVKTITPALSFDDGWLTALNYLSFSKYCVGKDYIFTYGPLYFLNKCLNIEPNLTIVKLFFLFEHVCAAWMLYLYKRAFPPGRFILFALALLAAQFLVHGDGRVPSSDEYVPIILLVMLLSTSLIAKSHVLTVSSILAGIYSGLLMFIKFDLLIEVIVTILGYFLLGGVFKKPYPRKASLVFFATWGATSLILATILFKEATNLFNWILTNFKTVCVYDTWSADCPSPIFLYLAITVILIYLLSISGAIWRREWLGYIGLILFPSILLGFKHGFVLAESAHIASFFKYQLVVIAFSIIFCRRKIEMGLLIISFFLLVPFALLLDQLYFKWHSVSSTVTGMQSRWQSMKLTNDFLSGVQEKGKYCEAVPYDLMWCFVNDVAYKPSPALFLSVAWAPAQKDIDAATYYSSPTSPDFLFCEHASICNGHMFFEAPRAWPYILACYQINKENEEKQLLLLEKKQKSRLPQFIPLKQFICQPQQWIPVPVSDHPLYCSFLLRPNLQGRILRLFYKLPSVFLNLKYSDGHLQSFRLMTAVAEHGILINVLPEDMEALRLLFADKTRQKVTEFQLAGPGMNYYQSPVVAQWLSDNSKVILTEAKLADNQMIITKRPPAEKCTVKRVFMFSPNIETADERKNNKDEPIYSRTNAKLINITCTVYQYQQLLPPKTVFLRIDNGPLIKTIARTALSEREGEMPTREAMLAGFRASVDIEKLPLGRHSIGIVIKSQNNDNFYQLPDVGSFITE